MLLTRWVAIFDEAPSIENKFRTENSMGLASRNAAERQNPPEILIDDRREPDQGQQRRFTQMRLKQQNKATFASGSEDTARNLSVPSFSRKATKLAPLKAATQAQQSPKSSQNSQQNKMRGSSVPPDPVQPTPSPPVGAGKMNLQEKIKFMKARASLKALSALRKPAKEREPAF